MSQIEVRLSIGGGSTFPFLLGTASGDAPLISFTVRSVPYMYQPRVKLAATDALGNTASSISAQNITIGTPPAQLYNFQVSPSNARVGSTTTVTVTLASAAPSSGSRPGATISGSLRSQG
ncbi:MAG TPA: hypothetical protein VF221_18050 [Chloroflexota bacterium]